MKFLIFISIFITLSVSAKTFSFHHGKIHTRLSLDNKKFTLKDHLGRYEIPIKDCNKKTIQDFWKKIEDSFYQESKKRLNKTFAKVSLDKEKRFILPFSKNKNFYLKLSDKTHSLIHKAKRVCKDG